MSEVISLEWIGQHIRDLQAEQRKLNLKVDLVYSQMTTRDDMLRMIDLVISRLSALDTRLEAIEQRLP